MRKGKTGRWLILIVIVLLIVSSVVVEFGFADIIIRKLHGTGTREFRGVVTGIHRIEKQKKTYLHIRVPTEMSSRDFRWIQQSVFQTLTWTIRGKTATREIRFYVFGLVTLEMDEKVNTLIIRDMGPEPLTQVLVFTIDDPEMVWTGILDAPPGPTDTDQKNTAAGEGKINLPDPAVFFPSNTPEPHLNPKGLKKGGVATWKPCG